ncbi:hypothetical protein J1TS3_37280 [Siminovitchia fordii]|uniref:Uncharacterized protein n=1 Tax=Siminovitchia fordii TaxID=254759 RepID=A0ABQ4KA35_9BACI|nr:hypothetical protein J1TS3_37280 [Siminovitchia fordii]
MERRLVSLQELKYIKSYKQCANFDFISNDTYIYRPKKQSKDIRKSMIKGYMKLLSNEIN